MKKEIDIIIPAFKAHKTLTQTLASIACQNCIDKIKVTVVNDCCPEGSYNDIIEIFKKLMDIQELILPKNSGPGVARQYGVDHTNCPYIMFVDADDRLAHPYAISLLLKDLLSSKKAKICMGAFMENFNFYNEKQQLLSFNNIPHTFDATWCFAKIYTRAFLKKHNLRFPPTRGNEDAVFNFMCGCLNDFDLDKGYIVTSDTLVYLWTQDNEESITRINDYQYPVDQSICGLADGLIYAFNWIQEKQLDLKPIIPFLLKYFVTMYFDYNIISSYPKFEAFKEQAWYYLKKFYRNVICKLPNDIETDALRQAYHGTIVSMMPKQELGNGESLYSTTVPVITFWDFVENLRNEPFNEKELQDILQKMPDNIKECNLRVGAVDPDYYNKKS